MASDVTKLQENLIVWAAGYGIAVGQADLDDDIAGKFDGPSIVLNEEYDPTERAFYLAHSIGSIAEWSIRPNQSQQIISELRQAKQQRDVDEARFDGALAAYLSFENTTWEYAVWLLQNVGQKHFVPQFTNFGARTWRRCVCFIRPARRRCGEISSLPGILRSAKAYKK